MGPRHVLTEDIGYTVTHESFKAIVSPKGPFEDARPSVFLADPELNAEWHDRQAQRNQQIPDRS